MEYPHDLVKISVYRSDRQLLKQFAARKGELMHHTFGQALATAIWKYDEEAREQNKQPLNHLVEAKQK